MTRPDLDAIEKRAIMATQGPWEQNGYVVNASHGIGDVIADAGLSPADARFIANARQDVPALIAEIRRLLNEQKHRRHVLEPDVSEHPRTVDDISAAIAGLPDDAQVFVNISGQGEDYAIDEIWASEQVSSSDETKRVVGVEIHLGLFPDPSENPSATSDDGSES